MEYEILRSAEGRVAALETRVKKLEEHRRDTTLHDGEVVIPAGFTSWRQRARSAESERDHLQTEVDRLTVEAKERERHIEELEARFAKARQFFTPGRERDAA